MNEELYYYHSNGVIYKFDEVSYSTKYIRIVNPLYIMILEESINKYHASYNLRGLQITTEKVIAQFTDDQILIFKADNTDHIDRYIMAYEEYHSLDEIFAKYE